MKQLFTRFFTLLTILTLGFTQLWAAYAPENNPATKTYAELTFLDVANTKANGKITATGATFEGDSTLAYSLRYVGQTLAITTWYNCSDGSPASNFESSPTYADAEINGFVVPSSTSGNIGYGGAKAHSGRVRYFYATGITSVAIISHDNGSSKYVQLKIEEVASNGDLSAVTTINSPNKSSSTLSLIEYTTALSPTKYYKISCTSNNSSNCKVYQIRFGKYIAPATSYTITYDANGGDGTMSNSTNTVSACTFTAQTGQEFKEWNTQADGLGDTWAVGATATSDLDLFAIWQTKVEKFTVVYKDGTTELGSEVVNVGQHPTGSGITAPTKDCYTFDTWSPALSTVSGSDGDEVVVNATWTPVYSSSATLISADVVSGKPNVNTVFAASNIVSSITFASGNYEFTNNETKKGYYGYKDKNSGDYMKILLQQGKRVKVLFGNLGANPTIKINGADGALDAARATGDNAENTFTYTASSADALIVITMGSGTNTLKKVDINALYNATFTDGTGDASGSESSVAEVTLPTPSETTVGGSTFTGWKANQIVKVAGVDQAIGTDIIAGTVVELTANTTFTAQWVTTSNYDVRFFPGYAPNEQIGTTQSISTGNYATAPDPDPTREGYRFLGWSIDGTEANIKDVASYAITAATDFTAVWVQQFEVTFNLQSYGSAIAAQKVDNGGKVSRPIDPIEFGQTFGGWFKESTCENAWDFATETVDAATELFAKWTAFSGCAEIYPATSGSALNAGDDVDLISGSHGGSIAVVGMKTAGSSILYDSYGLKFSGGSADVISVTLTNEMAVGTKINVKLVSLGTGSRGLNLLNETGGAVAGGTMLGWSSATNGAVETFSYTVTASDGLDGKNVFRLQRNNTVVLSCVTVESCGAALIYHDLTSAVDPTGKGTVTLGASSVREGLTTTATYSAIDAAYEFDEWEISGTGASIADASANPAVITMGTADAVVTLKLKVATVKHNVSFNTHGGSAVDPQEVEHGASPVEPTAPTKDEYIFQGWAEAEDGAIVDVTSFAITADKEFHAVWVAEPAGIKLLDGSTVNHTNFITGVTADETVEFKGNTVNYAKFSGTVSGVNGVKDLTRVIAYNATTNQTKIRISAHNNSTSARNILVKGLVEGADAAVDLATIALGNKEDKVSDWIEFNNAANRTIYIMVPSSAGDVYFTQVKVIEDGATPMKQAGEIGYAINLNKGRLFGPKETALAFEGFDLELSSDYQPINTTYAKIKESSISFTVAAPMLLSVTTSNNKTYYVTKGSAGTDNETAKTGVSEFDLTAGTWFITGGTAEVQITNIAFSAPKCAEPAFNSLVNSDICSGDPYVELNGTATVADAGVPTYQWYNADGDVEIGSATSATYTPSADGSYYVIATNHLTGFADNEKKSALVTVTTHASASITTAPADVRKDVGETATLTVVAAGKNLTYVWYKCDDELGTNPVAITPAETNATLTVTVTAGLNQYYKVVVSSDCGDPVSAVAKIEEWTELPQVNVSASATWDWTNAGENMKLLTDGTTNPDKDVEIVMANIKVGDKKPTNDGTFNSQALLFSGENVRAKDGGRYYASIGHIKFTTTVAGMVEVEFSDNGSNNRRLSINGKLSAASSGKTDIKTFAAYLPAGEVTLMGVKNDGTGTDQYIRISKIIFKAAADYDLVRDDSWLAPGELGTICYPNGYVVSGAEIYEMAGVDENNKFVFDEVTMTEPGKPYLFRVTTATPSNPIKFYQTSAAAAAEAGTSNGMVGTFTEITIPQASPNIYYFTGTKFYAVTARQTDLTVPANRAYVDLTDPHPVSAPSPGRRRVTFDVQGGQVATGIENTEVSDTPHKMVIDGQLFIIRGEKLYDATGRLVK